MSRWDIGEATLHSRFDSRIKPDLDAQRAAPGQAADRPVIIFTGGQPGAGKSNANARAKYDRPNLVEIIGDDLRQYHPDYAKLMRNNPLAMPDATAQASGRWVGMAADYTRSQRMDTLIETTLRQPDIVARTMTEFKAAGYEVELHVVAVPSEVSRLGTVTRYAGQVSEHGAGRWTPSSAHDVATVAVPGTVQTLLERGLVDRLVIVNRAGDELFTRDSRIGQVIDPSEAVKSLEGVREVAKLAPEAAKEWLATAEKSIGICASTKQTNGDLLGALWRVATVDAPRVAGAAYPGNERAQRAALGKINDVSAPLQREATKQKLADRIRQRAETMTKEPGIASPKAPQHDRGGIGR